MVSGYRLLTLTLRVNGYGLLKLLNDYGYLWWRCVKNIGARFIASLQNGETYKFISLLPFHHPFGDGALFGGHTHEIDTGGTGGKVDIGLVITHKMLL